MNIFSKKSEISNLCVFHAKNYKNDYGDPRCSFSCLKLPDVGSDDGPQRRALPPERRLRLRAQTSRHEGQDGLLQRKHTRPHPGGVTAHITHQGEWECYPGSDTPHTGDLIPGVSPLILHIKVSGDLIL